MRLKLSLLLPEDRAAKSSGAVKVLITSFILIAPSHTYAIDDLSTDRYLSHIAQILATCARPFFDRFSIPAIAGIFRDYLGEAKKRRYLGNSWKAILDRKSKWLTNYKSLC
jgi:hypothetical protein